MTERDIDIELVRLAQDGDRRAFELLVVRHQRRLARFLYRYVRSPQEIEDLVQETFLKAYRGLHSFRAESTFSTWLHRIAGHTAQNYLDYMRLRPRASGDDENESTGEMSGDRDSPENIMMSKQIAETISRAIDALPAVERESLQLREIEGLSYEEIANRMACPSATVRTRVFRARDRIAQELEPLLEPTRGRRW
jgi:RNA polymerase sigma-70 factor (ECF subfamily)